MEPAFVSEAAERQTVSARREREPITVDEGLPETRGSHPLETALATADVTDVAELGSEAVGRDEKSRKLDLPMTLGIATLVFALAIVTALFWGDPPEAGEDSAAGSPAAAESAARRLVSEDRSSDAVGSPGGSPVLAPVPEQDSAELGLELAQALESSADRATTENPDSGPAVEVEVDRAASELEAAPPASEVRGTRPAEVVSDAHSDFPEVPSDFPGVANAGVESAGVENTVRQARAQLAAGDWEAAVELAASANDLSASASSARELSNEILARARAAAASAQRQAEMIGAAVEGTRFFDDAVQLVTVGNQQSQESPLVAARSYYVASDLFRRSGEQASLRGMREAIGAYAKAYRDADFDVLSALWPTLSGTRSEAISSSFEEAKSVDVKIENCSMRLTEAGGSAVCELEQNYVPRRGMKQSSSSQVKFELRRRGSDWKIDAVDMTAP